jgi:hypothetical protein
MRKAHPWARAIRRTETRRWRHAGLRVSTSEGSSVSILAWRRHDTKRAARLWAEGLAIEPRTTISHWSPSHSASMRSGKLLLSAAGGLVIGTQPRRGEPRRGEPRRGECGSNDARRGLGPGLLAVGDPKSLRHRRTSAPAWQRTQPRRSLRSLHGPGPRCRRPVSSYVPFVGLPCADRDEPGTAGGTLLYALLRKDRDRSVGRTVSRATAGTAPAGFVWPAYH